MTRHEQHIRRYRRVAAIHERIPVEQREDRRRCLRVMDRILARARFDSAKKGALP